MLRFVRSKLKIFPPKSDADLPSPTHWPGFEIPLISVIIVEGIFHAETSTNDDDVNRIKLIGNSVCSASGKNLKDVAASGLRPVFLCHVRYVGMGIAGHVLTMMTPLDMVCILQHLIVRMLIPVQVWQCNNGLRLYS
jgi:hypothetical protein